MRLSCFVLLAGVACAQAPARLEFEVAAVRPVVRNANGSSPRPQTIGGPGTEKPTRITYLNYPLKWLLQTAYGLKDYQIAGPDWLNSEQCVIEATIRLDATKEQSNEMLRNLLEDRFKMALHRETRNLPVYELTLIKRGPKLKESLKEGANGGEPLPPAKGFGAPLFGLLEEKDGFLRLPPGMPIPAMGGPAATWGTASGIQYAVGGNQTIAGLATFLSNRSGRPVVDKTGLTGNWDYNLEFASGAAAANSPDNPSDPSPELVTAVREELGLKLESKKGPIEILVIDHMEKTPADN
jgi:uncharacterized protein (TIGR03435 family)